MNEENQRSGRETRLDTKSFQTKLHKSFFIQKEVKHLGYLLKIGGLKPQPKKIEATNRIITRLTNAKLLTMFSVRLISILICFVNSPTSLR